MTVWRLIPLLTASGHTQMAIDRWLLEQHRRGTHPPTLRFYTWQPIAISLGYHQRHYPDHWQHLQWQGTPIDVVRRPSGGRAVLHQGDLTYAVVTSGLAGTRMAAYRTLCEFLLQGWRSLGVKLEFGQAGRGYREQANCFGTATTADLVLPDGYKLIGSAQLRQGSAILQHGSMRLQPNTQLFQQVFAEPLMPPTLPWSPIGAQSMILQALITAASQCFDAEWDIRPLSEAEWQAIKALDPV